MSMSNPRDAREIRREIARLERDLQTTRGQLQAAEAHCASQGGHSWTEPKQDFRDTRVERVGGISAVHGVHVEYERLYDTVRKPYWFRVCARCDKREETTETTDRVTKVPTFR